MQPLRVFQRPHSHGQFAAIRRHDIHTGIDLYCDADSEVFAIEDGVVVDLGIFTGSSAVPPTPWWNDTSYVSVKGKSGTILYGEIIPSSEIEIGLALTEGQVLGKVTAVLKKDKGLPTTMLHLELYSQYTQPVEWALDTGKPLGLENPEFLIEKD